MLPPLLLVLLHRNFLGFAKEIFTDAGKYVVHFGYTPNTAAAMAEKTLAIRSGKDDVHVTPLAQLRTEVAVIPSVTGNQLVVSQPLPLDERMIALAAAISGEQRCILESTVQRCQCRHLQQSPPPQYQVG
jgi:hypothetical protein